mmetsp:Transcript_16551/g.29812  ORF Transcript_16551/g.29812 Transcript_16551/m.29812 type:complete len:100 (-) Transcript_16551:122-421(-)
MEGTDRKKAPVNSVSASVSGGTLHVSISGYLPNPACHLEKPTHTVRGNLVAVDLTMRRSAGMAIQVIVDYNESLQIDVHDWAPGQYTVSVNGHEASFSI